MILRDKAVSHSVVEIWAYCRRNKMDLDSERALKEIDRLVADAVAAVSARCDRLMVKLVETNKKHRKTRRELREFKELTTPATSIDAQERPLG